jgi:hypothetical protein
MIVSGRMVTTLMLLLLSSPLYAQQPGISLADVARQAEAAKPEQPKAKKAYSNADLNGAPRQVDEVAGSEPVRGYVSSTTGMVATPAELLNRSTAIAEREETKSLPEDYWRQRADSLRHQADQMRNRLPGLMAPNPNRLPAVQAKIDAEITKVRDTLNGLRAKWDQLEAYARASKVDVGWIGARPSFEP